MNKQYEYDKSPLLDIKLVKILKQLDDEMVRQNAESITLNCVGGFALMCHDVRKDKDAVTDIDYVGPALQKEVKEASDEIGVKNNIGVGWINNDILFMNAPLDELEFATGKLHFEEAIKLNKITVNILDKEDLLRLKVIAVDTNVLAKMSGDDFTRFKDFEDIKLLMNDLKWDMLELEMKTFQFIEEPDVTYGLIEDYIEKGREETMKSIDKIEIDDFAK